MYLLSICFVLLNIAASFAAETTFDTSRWTQSKIPIANPSGESLVLNTIDSPPRSNATQNGVILILHGWPETSHQFRHVITPLSDAGYRVIVPDYRGAGLSSKPKSGYEKFQMAEDMHTLIQSHFNISEKIHVVGNDIGGMIAWAYSARYPNDTASVAWGEVPLPGTVFWEEIYSSPEAYHFSFNAVPDLPEALVTGKERTYIQSFYDGVSVKTHWITDELVDYYAHQFSRPGALRAGFELYRAFAQDVKENKEWLEKNGKVKVPTLGMFGGAFVLANGGEMVREVAEAVEDLVIPGTGHWLAEESPGEWVEGVLKFVGKHS
ncbi:alpha/beta-hydrolase [Sporormia fimetaria CBS 119925]|uniref:Alpha/beta-hydrolase n=1 Tax=Sporormia fimetaria CBS 119925 TaxID=1340428 RepID=A0A6A6V139_9PLEO|nr:alpha/beta-hydrolase [Sporormia fimetaria CBS 119925]